MINMDLLKTEAYDFNLPENLIAQEPANPRDSAKMLVYNRKNNITIVYS